MSFTAHRNIFYNSCRNIHYSFYFKLNADQDYERSEQPLLVFSEGHLHYNQEKNGSGFNTTIFMRESNPFWLDGSMLGILKTSSVNNDGNEFWTKWVY